MIKKALIILCSAISIFAASAAEAEQTQRNYGEWISCPIGGGGYLQQVIFCPSDPERLYMTTDVGGLYISRNLGKTWHMLHGSLPPGGGAYEVRGLVVDPDNANHIIISCGSKWDKAQGIFISRDGGNSWKQTLKALFPGNGGTRSAGSTLVASPADKKLILTASYGNGLFRSIDEGENWTEIPGFKSILEPSAILFSSKEPEKVWLCIPGEPKDGKDSGLFFSNDSGENFTKIADKSPLEIIEAPDSEKTILQSMLSSISVSGKIILYGLISDRPVRSDDEGKTWTPVEKGLPEKPDKSKQWTVDGNYRALAKGPDFVVLGGNAGSFYLLGKDGISWEKIELGKVDEGNWWGRMEAGKYRYFGNALGYVAINPKNPAQWFFTDWYACYQSCDSGRSWTLMIDGVEMTVAHTVVSDPMDSKTVHAGVADVGYFRSENSGAAFDWVSTVTGGVITNNVKCISPSSIQKNLVYATGPNDYHWYANQLFISEDAGKSWKRSPMKGLPDMKKEDFRCNTVVADTVDPSKVYICISGKTGDGAGGVYLSRDKGQSWTRDSEGIPSGISSLFRKAIWLAGPEMAISSNGAMIVASCENGKIFGRSPAEKNWKELNTKIPGKAHSITADLKTPGRFYMAYQTGGLLQTDDNGLTWKKILNDACFHAAVHPENKLMLAAVTETGIQFSNDGGISWKEIGNGLPYRHRRNVVAFSNDFLLVGTGGSGLFRIKIR